MGFIRAYSEQGDPFPRRTLRAGRLRTIHGVQLRGPLGHVAYGPFRTKSRSRFVDVTHGRRAINRGSRRIFGDAGDPFSLRLPKVVRKLSLKKVVKGIGNVARGVLPIAAGLLTGGAATTAATLAGLVPGGSAPNPPELVLSPTPTGPVGMTYQPRPGLDYIVPGVEVSSERYDGTIPGDYDEGDYTGSDDDEDFESDEEADFEDGED